MGFEILFNCYEKNKDGRGYDMENPTVLKKQIGKMDDIPLEKVAAEIVKQMARRDVLIEIDKIFEYAKKEISFRETKGALIIKGQRFSLDGIPVESTPEVPIVSAPTGFIVRSSTEMPSNSYLPPTSLRERMGAPNSEVVSEIVPLPAQTSSETDNMKILRMESFDPDDPQIVIGRLNSKGMAFTVGNKYPIFKETPKEVTTRSEDRGIESNVLLIYKVSDDNGKIVELPSTYFRVPTPGLTFMGNQQQVSKPSQQRLLYMGNGSSYGSMGGTINVGADTGQMVSIRRGV